MDWAKLKICFLAGTLGQGGAERQLFYILKTLRENGAAVQLLCLTQGEFWEESIREIGVPVLWVGQSPSRWRRLQTIAREVRRLRPDVVQSQHFYTNLYAALAAKTVGVPSIGAVRNNVLSEVRAAGKLGNFCLQLPTVIAANSQAGMDNAARLGVASDRLFLLRNAVDTEQFAPVSARGEANGDSYRITLVGRLEKQKRVDRFLRSVALLRRDWQGAPLRVRIVGEGSLRRELEALAESLNLTECVTFDGALRDMAAVYARSDVLVLTSQHEGTPNVLLEAQACGVPVVATNVDGVGDVVRDGVTATLVVPGEDCHIEESVAAALRDFSDAARRSAAGAAARGWIEENYAVARLSHSLSALYTKVLPL